jgi:hypothetical protein
MAILLFFVRKLLRGFCLTILSPTKIALNETKYLQKINQRLLGYFTKICPTKIA